MTLESSWVIVSNTFMAGPHRSYASSSLRPISRSKIKRGRPFNAALKLERHHRDQNNRVWLPPYPLERPKWSPIVCPCCIACARFMDASSAPSEPSEYNDMSASVRIRLTLSSSHPIDKAQRSHLYVLEAKDLADSSSGLSVKRK